MDPIEDQIASARHETRMLYNEVELVRNKIRDATLPEVAKAIESIPKNYSNLKLFNTLVGHQNKVAQVKWSHDSTSILTASQDGFLIVWDAVTGFKRNAIRLENQWVLACGYSPSGTLISSGGLDNAVSIYSNSPSSNRNTYDQPPPGIQSVLKGHTAYISACEFTNDDTIITASGDTTCALWDVPKAARVRAFHEHLGDVLCLEVIDDSNTFLSGSSDGYAKLWDRRMKSSAQSFYVSNSDISCVSLFPGGNFSFVTGSDDGLIRFFDRRADCQIASYSMSAHFQPKSPRYSSSPTYDGSSASLSTFDNPGILSLDFSKSGRLVYTCYSDFGCMIWDTLKDEIIGTVGNDHMGKINEVAVSPNGLGVATASWDSTVKVWSV